MAVRQTLSTLLERTVAEVRSALHDEGFDPGPLEGRLSAIESALAERISGMEARLAELEAADAKLEKRLSMTMGAIQAATAQLLDVKKAVAQAENQAQQAMQKATSAHTTAEAAADGVGAVEDALNQN